MKLYILALLILIFQTSVLIKYITVSNFAPDFLSILTILYVLRHSTYSSLKFGGFIGFLQDLFSPSFSVANLVSKLLMVIFTTSVKRVIFVSNFAVQFLIIALLSAVDIFLKVIFVYFETGFFYLSLEFFAYIFLNLIVFGVYYIINEHKKG